MSFFARASHPQVLTQGYKVADISPAVGPISPDFAKYLTAMRKINEQTCSTRKQADELLQEYEPDLGVRQFILTNLGRDSTDEPYKIKLPLDYLEGAIQEIGAFPYEPGKASWDGPALFIKGTAFHLGSNTLMTSAYREEEQVYQQAEHSDHSAVLPAVRAKRTRCWPLGYIFLPLLPRPKAD